MHDFTIVEAFRASDFCVRLLEHFGDDAGLVEAREIQHRALVALAAEAGVTEQAAATSTTPTITQPSLPTGAAPAANAEGETEDVAPDPEMLEGDASMIGSQRLGFDPWSVVQVGTVELLDELPKKAAKEKVRAVAVEIATYEGPIHLDRLVDKTAESFGLQRVHAGRGKKLRYQIRQAGLFVDADKFVWPPAIDPGAWTEFRPSDSKADRPFTTISPVEIANAARFIRDRHPGISDGELEVATLQTFGRKRRTKQITAHLAKAQALL